MDNQSFAELVRTLSTQFSNRLENNEFIKSLTPGNLSDLIEDCNECEEMISDNFKQTVKPSAKLWLLKQELLKKIALYRQMLENNLYCE